MLTDDTSAMWCHASGLELRVMCCLCARTNLTTWFGRVHDHTASYCSQKLLKNIQLSLFQWLPIRSPKITKLYSIPFIFILSHTVCVKARKTSPTQLHFNEYLFYTNYNFEDQQNQLCFNKQTLAKATWVVVHEAKLSNSIFKFQNRQTRPILVDIVVVMFKFYNF